MGGGWWWWWTGQTHFMVGPGRGPTKTPKQNQILYPTSHLVTLQYRVFRKKFRIEFFRFGNSGHLWSVWALLGNLGTFDTWALLSTFGQIRGECVSPHYSVNGEVWQGWYPVFQNCRISPLQLHLASLPQRWETASASSCPHAGFTLPRFGNVG